VTPRSWRWTGRIRGSEEPPPPADPPPQPSSSLIDDDEPPSRTDRLLELAAEHATGALYLNGRWGGTVFLVHGRVGYVDSVLTPGVEALLLRPTYANERHWAALVPALRRGETEAAVAATRQLLLNPATSAAEAEILRRGAVADAALAALGTGAPPSARARFRPGERHWYEPLRTISVAGLLAEVERRQRLLARMTLGIQPGRAVYRMPQLALEQVRLTATQWNIVRLVDGDSTPQDIAWLLGAGVFATTVAVHQLARLGLLSSDPNRPETLPPDLLPARHLLSFVQAGSNGPAGTHVQAGTNL
jgi:hypothetical protein